MFINGSSKSGPRELVRRMLDRLAEATADPPGVTRAAYGPGEDAAHAIARAEAAALGAEITTDAAGNLFMTLPGADRCRRMLLTGSHLDSVPHGGNFDGSAGVVAGLAAMAALRGSRTVPPQDLTVVAFRAEEAAWFPLSYPGSLAALGQLDPMALGARRSDTGRSLSEHMRESGFDPNAVRQGASWLRPERLAAFVEIHIEQGPVLIGRDIPLGLVTVINGGFRHIAAKAIGEWAHSGATPFGWRRDAAMGVADLMLQMENWWARQEHAGNLLTITFGCISTDPALHGGSRIAGSVVFSIDVRAGTSALLDAAGRELATTAARITAARGVSIDLGSRFDWSAETCDPALLDRLERLAGTLGVPTLRMPSGAGHDAAAIAAAGIPTAMVFVRNANGSHNPHEAMAAGDLDEAVRLLTALACVCLS
jgi:N-carbamoyl-L-amino-acid hydrolase